jgi:homoserine kinase
VTSIKVTAPASTANIGPGFDCLGAAVSLHLEVEASDKPLPELVRRAAEAVAGELSTGGTVHSTIPMKSGLGSSGAAIAAGMLFGCAVSGKEVDRAELLLIGTPLEGHPDNLAASLHGGLTAVMPSGDVMRFDPTPLIRPMVLVGEEQVPTSEARRVLPEGITRTEAIANLSRTAGLLALLSGAVEPTARRLRECTEDLLHQRFRAPLMPNTSRALNWLRREGFAAALSGAGPSIVCLVVRGDEKDIRTAAAEFDDFELLELDWSTEGARVIEP